MTLLDVEALDESITQTWTSVCDSATLTPDRGVAALVGETAVAVFLLSGSRELVAVQNVDPFSGASVLSRGLVGSVEVDGSWVVYVASPLRKQRFDLRTGVCLDDPGVVLQVFDVALDGGMIVVRPSGGSEGPGSSWGNVHETPS